MFKLVQQSTLCISFFLSLSLPPFSLSLSLSLSLFLSLSLSACLVSLFSFSMSITLAGTDIIARTTVSVLPGAPLNYHWKEHGLKLYAPANAMEQKADPVTLNIQAIHSDGIQLPENVELVSGVYVVTFPQQIFQPVRMELQHCASLEHPHQLPSLSFVTAKSMQGLPPYQFQLLPGGIFPAKASYGNIQLSQSSGVAIVNDGSKNYTAVTYYIPQSATTWLVYFFIMWDLELSLQVCTYV